MKKILPLLFGVVVIFHFGRLLLQGEVYQVIGSYIICGLLFLGGVILGIDKEEMNISIGTKIVICWLPAIFSKQILIWCWK